MDLGITTKELKMSTFIVPITRIREILPHDNAEKLEIAKVYDWNVVVGKGQYKAGDYVMYVPVDSILPQELEDKVFGPDSKIKLHKHRVRSIKIRGQISQGLIIDLKDAAEEIETEDGDVLYWGPGNDLGAVLLNDPDLLDKNVADLFNITKYEPQEKDLPQHMQVAKKKKAGNPNFQKYSSIENFKYYDRVIQDNEQVYISEKLHGTSTRYGWVKTEANTFWKKFLKYIGKLPEYEFVWGSRTVEISAKLLKSHDGCNIPSQGVNFGDIYTKMIDQYNLKEVIPKGRVIYGEIVGDGVQRGYNYGCGKDEHKLYVYDIMNTEHNYWLDFPQMNRDIKEMGLTKVPTLYVGPFSKEIAEEHRKGDSTLHGQKVREGIVIRPVVERKSSSLSRVILKFISDEYYLNKDNTDFH